MKRKAGLMGGLLLIFAFGLGACSVSPEQAAAGQAYLAKAKKRIAAIENAEATFHGEDTRCGDHSKARVEEALGKLVEARVYAKEEIARLDQEGAQSKTQIEQRLEGKLKLAEHRLSEVQRLCQSS